MTFTTVARVLPKDSWQTATIIILVLFQFSQPMTVCKEIIAWFSTFDLREMYRRAIHRYFFGISDDCDKAYYLDFFAKRM